MKIFIIISVILIGIVAVPTVFAGSAPTEPSALYSEMGLAIFLICAGIYSAIYPRKFSNFYSKLSGRFYEFTKFFLFRLQEEMWLKAYMLTFTRAISIFLVFIGIALLLRDFIVI